MSEGSRDRKYWKSRGVNFRPIKSKLYEKFITPKKSDNELWEAISKKNEGLNISPYFSISTLKSGKVYPTDMSA